MSASCIEYAKKEFPKRGVKRTKTLPVIEWSFNPRHDSAAYLMSRKDIMGEATIEEMKYLSAIIDGESACNETRTKVHGTLA